MSKVEMEQKDFDALVDKLGEKAFEKINSLVSDAEKGNKEALTELKSRVDEVSKVGDKSIVEFVKTIQEHTNNLEKQLKESQEYSAKGMSVHQQFVKQLESKQNELKSAMSKGSYMDIDLKSAVDMSITDNVGSGVIEPLYLPGITSIAKARPALWELLNKIPWMRERVYYNQIESETGDPAFKKEAADSLGDAAAIKAAAMFPKRSYKIENKELKLEKIGVHSKITMEMIENIPDFVSWIQQELLRDVLLTLNTKLYTGTGTAPEFKGLQHADFRTAAAIPGDYKLPSGVTPNESQALRAIITQMINGYFNPTAILLNPTDAMKLDLAVDKNGTPIIHPFSGRDNTSIKGVPIFEMPQLTAGKFHIIDGSRIALYIQRGLNLRIWDQNEDDPLYDRKTLTASIKCAPLVKANEKAANIYGDLSDLITALTASAS